MHSCVCHFGDDVYDAMVLGVMRFDEVGVELSNPLGQSFRKWPRWPHWYIEHVSCAVHDDHV